MGAGVNDYTTAEADEWNSEFTMNYGQSEALLPSRCARNGWSSGSGTVTFTIVENNQTTTTRGVNGDIVYGNTDQSTVSVDLEEVLGGEEIDNFTAFKSSVDQRKIMYRRVESAIKRKMDDKILAQLATTSNSLNEGELPGGSGSDGFPLSRQNAQEVTSLFHELTVGAEGVATGLVSIRAFAYLEAQTQVSSRDYNNDMPLVKGYKPFTWQGILWMPYARGVSGAGTNAALCYLFHMDAIGFHEAGQLSMIVDFDKKNRKHFCNGQEWCASKLLLDDGVLQFKHDDTVAFPS